MNMTLAGSGPPALSMAEYASCKTCCSIPFPPKDELAIPIRPAAADDGTMEAFAELPPTGILILRSAGVPCAFMGVTGVAGERPAGILMRRLCGSWWSIPPRPLIIPDILPPAPILLRLPYRPCGRPFGSSSPFCWAAARCWEIIDTPCSRIWSLCCCSWLKYGMTSAVRSRRHCDAFSRAFLSDTGTHAESVLPSLLDASDDGDGGELPEADGSFFCRNLPGGVRDFQICTTSFATFGLSILLLARYLILC
mmetsp:Transcript_34548/g.83412  ORF Transcript_34548/g.83412 Transcript_34548/m.83412 type:complete len:252 (-) Transcript_34548:755-1510(-)